MDKRKEMEAFREMMYDKYNVQDNPKREKAFRLAWNLGHASGYDEVEALFSQVVELIK